MSYLHKRLLCECVAKARQRGMPYVGLQNFGECWSSNNAAKDYPKRGRSSQCVNGSYKKCKAGQFCIGKAFTNYVYAISKFACTAIAKHKHTLTFYSIGYISFIVILNI